MLCIMRISVCFASSYFYGIQFQIPVSNKLTITIKPIHLPKGNSCNHLFNKTGHHKRMNYFLFVVVSDKAETYALIDLADVT